MAIRIDVGAVYTDDDIKRAHRDLNALGRAAGYNSATFSQKFAEMGQSMANFGTTLTTRVTLPLVALGGLSLKFASDLEEATNKVDVVFGNSADAVKAFADDAATSFGFSEAKALEAAGTYGNLFRAMGIGENVSADLSTSLVGLAGDLASFNNANPEEVFLALRAGLSGETEPLKRFGVNLNQARIEAEALNLGLIQQGQEMDAAAKAQAVYSLIMQDTALAQGDFARTSDGAANKTKILRARFEDIAAQLGEVLIPVFERVADKIDQLAGWFSELDPSTRRTIVMFAAMAAAIGPVLLVVGKLMGAIVALKAVFAGIAAVISAPVLAVVAVIAALVAAVVIAWQRSEEFRATVTKAWEDIKTAVIGAWEGFIKPALNDLVAAFQNHVQPALENLLAKFQEVWPAIRDAVASFWGYAQPVLQFLVAIISNVLIPVLAWLLSTAFTVWTGMASFLAGAWTSVFQPILSGISSLISNVVIPAFTWLWQTAQTVWGGVSGVVSSAWGFMSGVFESIKSGIGSVATWFSDRVNDIKNVFSTIGDAISAPFAAAFQAIKDLWNSTLGGKGFTVPDIPGVPGRGQRFEFPTFDKGGMVPGIPGDPQLAIVHAGEMILRQTEIDEYRSKRRGSQGQGGGDVNVYVNKTNADPYEIGRELLWTMKVAG